MATDRLVYLLELIVKHSLDQNPAKIPFTMHDTVGEIFLLRYSLSSNM